MGIGREPQIRCECGRHFKRGKGGGCSGAVFCSTQCFEASWDDYLRGLR